MHMHSQIQIPMSTIYTYFYIVGDTVGDAGSQHCQWPISQNRTARKPTARSGTVTTRAVSGTAAARRHRREDIDRDAQPANPAGRCRSVPIQRRSPRPRVAPGPGRISAESRRGPAVSRPLQRSDDRAGCAALSSERCAAAFSRAAAAAPCSQC